MVEQFDYYGDAEPATYQDSPLNKTLIPLLLVEGFSLDHHSNLINTCYVDFRMPHERSSIEAVIKFSSGRYSIEHCKAIKLARPSHFRMQGETLIYDTGEGIAIKETVTQSDSPILDMEYAAVQLLEDEINRAIELSGGSLKIHSKQSARTVTNTHRESLEWGKEAWIFCTAMEPRSREERKALLESLDPDYDHESHIQSTREFAQMLGRAYVEQYGSPKDNKESMKHSVNGAYMGTTHHPQIVVFHGPVMYVDDPYATYEHAALTWDPWEKMLLPIFTKDRKFSGQREYRFVILDNTECDSDVKIMSATPALLAIVGQHGNDRGPMVVPDFDTTGAEPIPPAKTTGAPLIRNLPMPSITKTDIAKQYADSPTIPNRHKIQDGEEVPNDLVETVGVYPAMATLHEKIDHSMLGITAAQPERKPYITSAAWYAEQSIRRLCHRFGNPIAGLSITDDNHIIIEISLPNWKDSECNLVVTPSGAYALTLISKSDGKKTTHASVAMLGPSAMATSLEERHFDTIARFEP